MDKRIEYLGKQGCNIKEALDRMFNDEEFYLECLMEIPDDQNFNILRSALENHDTQTAFDAAHTLKGVLSNLSLTPLYNKIVEIVEPLRAGNDNELIPKFNELFEMKNKLGDILKEG